jgi:hypothetical protein
MLKFGKKFRALHDKKNKYSNSCDVRKKNSQRNKKHNPPTPLFKLNGRSLNKNWIIYWSEQSFTGLGPEDRCSSWGLPFFLYSFLWFIIFFSSIFVEFYCIFIITMSFWVKRFHPWNLQNLRNILLYLNVLIG